MIAVDDSENTDDVDDNENIDAKKVIPNGVGARTERFYEGKLGHHHNDVDLCRNCF